ncbi:LysR family transcriptional regulator [Noviherbaspirillum aerium]|uniref:LysR family transcriptional regulator n=1 Tax=Noviherbaspirillum aerium TaxID=2588497 RepID=UPI00124F45E9|nr:LysR family transcriptional regulator [Noviherbaspirillum aerium]
MDQLSELKAFCRVVEAGSFSAAAAAVNVSHTVVSRQVRQLENRLGVQLLNRTTRKLALTEPGRSYYERARRILDDLQDADLAMAQHHSTPAGRLRINAPMAFGTLDLALWLPRFLDRYPELQVELVCNDRHVDLIEDGFDVGLRLARDMPDSTLVARKLATMTTLLVASPSYLQRHGTPVVPADLARHNCLTYTIVPRPQEWTFVMPDGDLHSVTVRGSLQANTGVALRQAALGGIGIATTASFIVQNDLAQESLIPVLPGYPMRSRSLYAVYPQSHHLPAKVRAFVEFAADIYRQPAWS